MRMRQRVSVSLTPDSVRSTTERTGHGGPPRRMARTSAGRVTACIALHTAPVGSDHSCSPSALMASILTRYSTVADQWFQQLGPLGMLVGVGVGDVGGLKPTRMSSTMARW